ncbi:MAG: CHASE2 domain-containing protein [Bryobacteraceae bacterium]
MQSVLSVVRQVFAALPPSRRLALYAAVLAATFAIAQAASWSELGALIDSDAYDWMFRLVRPAAGPARSVLVAVDEETLQQSGGMRQIRTLLAEALDRSKDAKAIAVDVVLSDPGDPAEDALLEEALRRSGKVVLACEMMPAGGVWEDPLPRFRSAVSAVGHVHAEPDPVSREVLLHKIAGRDRRWALAVEAYRVGAGVAQIEETPADVRVGSLVIPASDRGHRAMRIRYRPPESAIPVVTLAALRRDPALASRLLDRTVFVGVTAISAAKDRLQTPYTGRGQAPGVEINANVFETIAQGTFLVDVPGWVCLLASLAIVLATGLCFWFLSGWAAYAGAFLLLAGAHALPVVLFANSLVLPFTMPVFSAWLAISSAASFQHFVVRRGLLLAEDERLRYQQAIHFVVHEMRTPLTAIQGSSELIGRYPNLPEAKRNQIASLINTESKRLGRLIQVFLDVERLASGQMELRRDSFDAYELIVICVERVRPLAERKRIRIELEPFVELPMNGDRELMEYAFYNLLTNAVKYSPPDTVVDMFARRDGGEMRISFRDQGIGMDSKEVKQIFQKFYRTKKAEESGEKGTGIGLSIVKQIVARHRGKIDVESSPGRGSCFTLVLPVHHGAGAPAS